MYDVPGLVLLSAVMPDIRTTELLSFDNSTTCGIAVLMYP